jgi:hypothetical protein
MTTGVKKAGPHLAAAGVLLALLAVFYFPFLSGRAFLWEDLLYMAHPAFNYLATSLASGHFPLWLSGLRSGIPFFSEPWVYYPPFLALAGFVNDGKLSSLAIQWCFVSQLFMGGVFAYVFLRASRLNLAACLTGMVVFVFSGFLSLHLIHGGMGPAFLWLPLELFLVKRIVERRQVAQGYLFLILAIWMSVLAGFPQSVLYNAYFLAAYWLFLSWRQPREAREVSLRERATGMLLECVKIAGVFVVVGLLSAVVILSTVQSWSTSHRQEFGFAQIADQSLPWYYLIHGLVPNFFGMVNGDGSGVPFWGFNKDTQEYATWHAGAWMYWEFGFYAGQLALIAVAVLLFNIRKLWATRREAVFFLCALLVILWLMLGRYGGLFNLFYHIAPGFSMFRTPARLSGLLDFCLAVLVAVLVHELLEKKQSLNLRKPIAFLVVSYIGFLLWFLVGGDRVFPELKEPTFFSHALNQTLFSMLLFGLMATVIVIMARLKSGWLPVMAASVLIALAFGDLYFAFHRFHQGKTSPEQYFADRGGLISQLTQMRGQAGPFRFAQLRDGKISEEVVFPRNIGYLYPGYEAIEGYILFNLKDLSLFNSMTNEQARLDIQNVGVMANADRVTGRVNLMRNANALPRAKFYHRIRAYDDAKSLCADLDAGRLDYRNEIGVLREECIKYGIPMAATSSPVTAQVHFIPKTPDEYQISYQTTGPGIIFISENYYPGWQADGGQYPVVHAFGAFKGVVIPRAGNGIITLRFSPWPFKVGLAISLTTLVGLIVVCGWMGWRRRRG